MWVASSECAVQTNGLYSPPGQGPGPGHGLTHPPPGWFTSLRRPHYRNGDVSGGGFQVQVFDLDQPMTKTADFSPPMSSTLKEDLGEHRKAQGLTSMNQQTEEKQVCLQQFHTQLVSSDPTICEELLSNTAIQSSLTDSAVPNEIQITSKHDWKRSRFVKSASTDGNLGSQQNSLVPPDFLMPKRNSLELFLSTESLVSLMPELAPVVDPELPGTRSHNSLF